MQTVVQLKTGITLTMVGVLAACQPDPLADLPPDSAAHCFHPELYNKGNEYLLENTDNPSATSHVEMLGHTTFRQQQVVQERFTDEIAGSKGWAINYYQIKADTFTLQKLGYEMNDGRRVYWYEPARALAYNMQPNDTEKYTEQVHYQYASAQPATNKPPLVRKFIGMETVKTPAGTFATCHFDIISTDHADKPPFTLSYWYAQTNGMLVRLRVAGQGEYQLRSADINGQHWPN